MNLERKSIVFAREWIEQGMPADVLRDQSLAIRLHVRKMVKKLTDHTAGEGGRQNR